MEKVMYFGGVEGGATHSNLVICKQSGEVVGSSRGPGTNHWAFGMEECVNRIVAMVHAAKADAGIPEHVPLDSLGLSLSGCEQDSSNAELARLVLEGDSKCARAVYVASDTAGSLYTGAPNGGMVLIAGTGSNAFLRTADGKQYGCGGWGHILGDEGAAYWIAHRAVKCVIDDADGLSICPHRTDRVWDAIREHFEVETRTDLIPHAYKHFQKPKFAGLTAKLSELAYSGDALSQSLFAAAGEALSRHAAALLRHSAAPRVRVVCVGSLWKSWSLLKGGMLRVLNEAKIQTELEFVLLRVSSALGGAWLAAKHVGYNLPRDDTAFCQVFHTYIPNSTSELNGTNGTVNGKCLHNDIGNGHGDCNVIS